MRNWDDESRTLPRLQSVANSALPSVETQRCHVDLRRDDFLVVEWETSALSARGVGLHQFQQTRFSRF